MPAEPTPLTVMRAAAIGGAVGLVGYLMCMFAYPIMRERWFPWLPVAIVAVAGIAALWNMGALDDDEDDDDE